MFNRKEYMREYKKEYQKNNVEKIKKYKYKWEKDNPEEVKKYIKKWRENNPEKIMRQNKEYYKNNREKIMEQVKRWQKDNPEKALKYIKQWQGDNPEKVKEYYEKNKKRVKEHFNNKYRTSLKFNLNCRMRRAITKSLKGNKNGRHWENLIDYTLGNLIGHLKKTIPKNYNWQDFIEGKLHIDHIIPIRAFIFKTPEDKEFKDCWNLYNLRLLPKKENRLKHDRINNTILLSLLINNIFLKG